LKDEIKALIDDSISATGLLNYLDVGMGNRQVETVHNTALDYETLGAGARKALVWAWTGDVADTEAIILEAEGNVPTNRPIGEVGVFDGDAGGSVLMARKRIYDGRFPKSAIRRFRIRWRINVAVRQTYE
jgi:hypothetical protein